MIGYATARLLRQSAKSMAERDAIQRLAEFRADEKDALLAAAVAKRSGDYELAAELLRLVKP
jgi:hypothetical protein